MPDREKVIKGVHDARRYLEDREWVEKSVGVHIDALNDALALLKQEAVEPKQVELYGKDDWYGLVCVCPDCKAEWMGCESETHFCPNCGRQVKWDDT